EFDRSGDDPVDEGRLLEVFDAVEPRGDPVAAGHHLARDLSVAPLVRRPQSARPQGDGVEDADPQREEEQVAPPEGGGGARPVGLGRGDGGGHGGGTVAGENLSLSSRARARDPGGGRPSKQLVARSLRAALPPGPSLSLGMTNGRTRPSAQRVMARSRQVFALAVPSWQSPCYALGRS